MNVHLVDGTFELFRAYYGSPPSTDANGKEVGAARGLARSLLSLLGERDVTHVAIAFDHVIESFRNDSVSGLQDGRGHRSRLSMRSSGWPRRPAARSGSSPGRWSSSSATTRSRRRPRASPRTRPWSVSSICSPDKDLAQCVRGERVVCFDRMRRKRLDERGVVEKFGVQPKSIPDWLALVGDSADGFPGIPRWGAKSAAAVLGAYERLEAIPADAAAWTVPVRGAAAFAASFVAHRTEALLFRQLATLRTDVPLTESLPDLRWRGPDAAALAALARLWGDSVLAERAARVAQR